MNIAVIFAGGIGSRMHSKDKPKQFLELYGKPILVYTLEHFQRHEEIDKIVLVIVDGWINYAEQLIKYYGLSKVIKVVKGGVTGQLSIYNGLCVAKELADNKDSIVLIHDGVRPLINEKVITDNINSVKQYGNAITSIPAIESIVITNENNQVERVVDRHQAKIARAPQSFYLKDILACHEKALNEGKKNFIDSCTIMTAYDKQPVHLVEGPIENIKITTPEDFYIMRAIIEARENKQLYELE